MINLWVTFDTDMVSQILLVLRCLLSKHTALTLGCNILSFTFEYIHKYVQSWQICHANLCITMRKILIMSNGHNVKEQIYLYAKHFHGTQV